MPTTIVWFRRDLRLTDNPALLRAALRRGPVLPVYLLEWEDGSEWAPGAATRWWVGRSLEALGAALQAMGSRLFVLRGEPATVLPSLAASVDADLVVWNRLYEPFSHSLDERVEEALRSRRIDADVFSGHLLFEPEEHVSRAGKKFVQFGAFWRSCLSLPEPAPPAFAPAPLPGLPTAPLLEEAAGGLEALRAAPPAAPAPVTTQGLAAAWRPGETGAAARLRRFIDEALAGYARARDYPGEEGVSRLSPHLHFGEISPHQVWHAAKAAGPAQAAPFLRQLGWREFAHYLLHHFPYTPSQPFRPEFAAFPWQDDHAGLEAWRAGATGYPLVDAGMRQLLDEGWVHNRVRMVVASFLTKDLLIPWQEGARWYWDHLVDADLANNTLGWQWTAGSGPDAAPYFRVYNPRVQAERFDPDRMYVQRWLPGGAPAAPPVVDHAQARLRALAAFHSLRRT